MFCSFNAEIEAHLQYLHSQLRVGRRHYQSEIDRYLVACTCIGIGLADGDLYAPHGLAEMAAGVLRRNPLTGQPALFRAKAEDYRARWPFLTIADG